MFMARRKTEAETQSFFHQQRKDTIIMSHILKPGLKTSEFWVTVATVTGSLAATLQPFAPLHPYAQVAALLTGGISSAAYAISRAKAKTVNPS
jgi:hypothetical protein